MIRGKWLAGLLLGFAVALSAAQPISADEQGWGLLVLSPIIGKVYVYMTSKGFAIVIPKTGAKFVTHSPDWLVVLYNDKTKLYFVERMSDLQVVATKAKSKQAQALRRTAMQNARQGKTDKTTWGMTETQYFINTYSPEGGAKRAEAWITNDIRPPEQFKIIMSKIFSIDTSGFPEGMPLKVRVADDVGKTSLVFETLKCERQTIHSASFNYPSTYKRAESELAVLVDETSRKKMESILEDSEDLNSILGSSGQTTRPATSYSTSRPATNYNYSSYQRYSSPPARPMTPAATPNKPAAGGDWWSNMFNSLGGKK